MSDTPTTPTTPTTPPTPNIASPAKPAKTKNPGFSGIARKDLTWSRVAAGDLDVKGLRVAVVGGTNGLGRALALRLARQGASVTVVGQTFRDAGVANVSFMKADLSRMVDAQRVGRELPAEELDLLVLTTGIITAPTREETAEGLERDLAISYLSRLVLLRELAPRLGSRRVAPRWPRARVFVMGFPGTNQAGNPADLNAERSYKAMPVHMNTVAGNEALVLDAARRYAHLDVFGLNPGLVKTGIRSNFLGDGSFKHRLVELLIGLLMPSATTYGDRTVPLLVAPELSGRSSSLFNAKGVAIEPSAVMTAAYVREYIAASEQLLGQKVPGLVATLGLTAAAAPLHVVAAS